MLSPFLFFLLVFPHASSNLMEGIIGELGGDDRKERERYPSKKSNFSDLPDLPSFVNEENIPFLYDFDCVDRPAITSISLDWNEIFEELGNLSFFSDHEFPIVLKNEYIEMMWKNDRWRHVSELECPIGFLYLGLIKHYQEILLASFKEEERRRGLDDWELESGESTIEMSSQSSLLNEALLVRQWVMEGMQRVPFYFIQMSRWPFFEYMERANKVLQLSMSPPLWVSREPEEPCRGEEGKEEGKQEQNGGGEGNIDEVERFECVQKYASSEATAKENVHLFEARLPEYVGDFKTFLKFEKKRMMEDENYKPYRDGCCGNFGDTRQLAPSLNLTEIEGTEEKDEAEYRELLDWDVLSMTVSKIFDRSPVKLTFREAIIIRGSLDYVFSKSERADLASEECVCGVAFLTLLQSFSSADRYSQHLAKWSSFVHNFFSVIPFTLIAGSRWPVLKGVRLFGDVTQGSIFTVIQPKHSKKRRTLHDISPTLKGILHPFGDSEERRNEIPRLKGPAHLYSQLKSLNYFEDNVFFEEALFQIQRASFSFEGRYLILSTVYFGSKFEKLLVLVAKRFFQFTQKKLLVVCSGVEGFDSCKNAEKSQKNIICWKIDDEKSLIHRFVFMHIAAYLGIDTFNFDLDILFLKNPLKQIANLLKMERHQYDELKENRSNEEEDVTDEGLLDLRPGSDFFEFYKNAENPSFFDQVWTQHSEADCINIGISYVKGNPKNALFLNQFVQWFFLHPWEVDQRGIDKFLKHSKNINVSFLPRKIPVIKYRILERKNEFLTTPQSQGWVGFYEEVVVFHYANMEISKKLAVLLPLYDKLLAGFDEGIAEEEAFMIPEIFDHLKSLKVEEMRPDINCW